MAEPGTFSRPGWRDQSDPRPQSTEMMIHIGYLRAGWPGLLAAGISFVLPAVLLTTALAWAYVEFGMLPAVQPFLMGIKPAVLAVILGALWRPGADGLEAAGGHADAHRLGHHRRRGGGCRPAGRAGDLVAGSGQRVGDGRSAGGGRLERGRLRCWPCRLGALRPPGRRLRRRRISSGWLSWRPRLSPR